MTFTRMSVSQSRITNSTQFKEQKSEKPAVTFCTSYKYLFLPCSKNKAKAHHYYEHRKGGYSWWFIVGSFFANLFCFLLFRGCLAISKVEEYKSDSLVFLSLCINACLAAASCCRNFYGFLFTLGLSSYSDDFCLLSYLARQSSANQ